MHSRRLFLTLGSLCAVVACSSAPMPPHLDGEDIRDMLITGFEQYKAHDIEIAAAIPDSALRWAPNDDVRDFAEMVDHYANNLWLGQFTLGNEAQSVGDTAVYLNDNAALGEVVTQWYDMVIADLRTIPADDFFTEVDFFGGQRLQKWQIYSFGLQHVLWTRGGLIPYFRAHGVPVPAFRSY
jgi:hypothetical protein